MKEYLDMWKNYANFSGRTSVRGYWMAVLVNMIITFVIGLVVTLLHLPEFISTIYSLAILIPGLAITVRRLRDAGFKWTAIFLNLIPLVGFILLIIKLCKHSVSDAAA